jgi:hypothetical protein
MYNSCKHIKIKSKQANMFSKLFVGAGVLICANNYFTPPSNFDAPPSPLVKEWMKEKGASRNVAELLVWHGVILGNERSPAAIHLLNYGYPVAFAELKIRGYESGPKGWDEPVRTSMLGEVVNAVKTLLAKKVDAIKSRLRNQSI